MDNSYMEQNGFFFVSKRYEYFNVIWNHIYALTVKFSNGYEEKEKEKYVNERKNKIEFE